VHTSVCVFVWGGGGGGSEGGGGGGGGGKKGGGWGGGGGVGWSPTDLYTYCLGFGGSGLGLMVHRLGSVVVGDV